MPTSLACGADASSRFPALQLRPRGDRKNQITDDEKFRIPEESCRDGMTVAEVARRHEIRRSMLNDWRHRPRQRQRLGLRGGSVSFMRVIAMEDPSRAETRLAADVVRSSALTVDLGGWCRVTVLADFDTDAAARSLNGQMVNR